MKWAIAAATLLVMDEVNKWTTLQHGGAVHKNLGIAFDLPIPSFVMIPLIAAIVVCASVFYYRHQSEPRFTIPLTFVIAGGLGNLFDRIHWGFIVDYLIIHTSAFNISDLMILGGAFALVFSIDRAKRF